MSEKQGVLQYFTKNNKLPYQAKLHEYGIEAAKDDWLAYRFELLDAEKLDPITEVDQIRTNLKEQRKILRKLMHFAYAGENDPFYTRVIAWSRMLNIIENIVDSDAEPDSKVTLCRDFLYRADMMLEVSVTKDSISPTKTFGFQGIPSTGATVSVTTQNEDEGALSE